MVFQMTRFRELMCTLMEIVHLLPFQSNFYLRRHQILIKIQVGHRWIAANGYFQHIHENMYYTAYSSHLDLQD